MRAMKVRVFIPVVCIAALALAACQTAGGTGSGNVRCTRTPVAFTWQSTGSSRGDITATLPSGRTFKGTYFQITRETRVDELHPLWNGWGRPYRRGWGYWGPDPGPRFVKEYSGRVLANLHTDDGEHMRCRFRLASPSSGMSGGGQGRCELSEGGEINAEFPRA